MSTVGKAIYTVLTSDATLAALVSNRVYPATVPARASIPYVVYTQVGNAPTDDKDGPSALDSVMIQVDAYASNKTDSVTITERVRVLLDRLNNQVSGVNIDSVIFDGENDGDYNAQLGVYWTSQDYRFRIKRAGAVTPTAQYFSQEFTYAQLTGGGTTATVTANGGVLPSNPAAITVLIDLGAGAFIFTTEYTVSGSDIVLNSPLPASGRMLVNFVILPTGITAYRQIFTGISGNSVTITDNGGVLPSNPAALLVHLNGIFTTEYTASAPTITFPFTLLPTWQVVATFYI